MEKKFTPVYCTQHMAIHMTDWCTVGKENPADFVSLRAFTAAGAIRECHLRGLKLYGDRSEIVYG